MCGSALLIEEKEEVIEAVPDADAKAVIEQLKDEPALLIPASALQEQGWRQPLEDDDSEDRVPTHVLRAVVTDVEEVPAGSEIRSFVNGREVVTLDGKPIFLDSVGFMCESLTRHSDNALVVTAA